MNDQNIVNNTKSCPSCGNTNLASASFCVNCGAPFPQPSVDTPVSTVDNTSNYVQSQNVVSNALEQSVPSQTVQQPVQGDTAQMSQPIYQQANAQVNVADVPVASTVSTQNMNYFGYILNSLLKPHKTFKDNEENLSNFKNSGILSLILIAAVTIIDLFSTILNTVRVKNFWTGEVEWVWENIKNIEFIKVIGQSILVGALILCVIAGVYFLAALIMKKEVKFPKLLGIVTTAYLPIAISSSILLPILSMIYAPLGIGVAVVGFIYGLVILIELMHEAIPFDNKDTKIYFHMACLSIAIIVFTVIVYLVLRSAFVSMLY